MRNANDWLAATAFGGDARPINPRALAGLVTKASAAKSPGSLRTAQRLRRLRFEVAQIDAPATTPKQRRWPTRTPTIAELAAPGPAGYAANMRHAAIVQHWRKPF